MTALLQLGLVHEQGAQPAADLIGARQTIDTISLLAGRCEVISPPKKSACKQCSLRTSHGLCGGDQHAGPSAGRGSARPESRNKVMRATLTVLGSGTSMGVPTIGCTCNVCRSADPHDRRTRPFAYGGVGRPPDRHRHHAGLPPAGVAREHHHRQSTPCYTPTAMPITFSGSTICGR